MVQFFKMLTAVSAMVLGVTAVVSITGDAGAEESTGAQVGTMIDAAQAAAEASMTAEGALPDFHEIQTPTQTAKSEQPDMDAAVKMALAKTPATKGEAEVRTDGGTTVTGDGGAAIGGNSEATPLNAGANPNAIDESKQPVFSETAPVKVKKSSAENIWWRMWGSLAIVFVMMGGGFYAFKKWPGNKKFTGRNRMIEVLSQHHLGPKRSLAVVRVAGEACLIGITDSQITILKTLSLLDDDVPTATKTAGPEEKLQALSGVFQKTLAARFTKSPETSPTYTRAAKKSETNEDDFSMQGLREIVGEKLRTMKEL